MAEMIRKHVSMSPEMIERIDDIVKLVRERDNDERVSFAEVVRRAVERYSLDENQDDERLEEMVHMLVSMNRDASQRLKVLNRQLDETHRTIHERMGANGAR